jgi:hypothetical protein
MFKCFAVFLILSSIGSASEESNLFLGASSKILKDSQSSEPVFIENTQNTNLEYPRRKDFVTVQENVYGKWMKPIEIPYGHYIKAIAIKNEGALWAGDDSSNNEISVLLAHAYGEGPGSGNWVSTNYGEYGKWVDSEKCQEHHYLSGAYPYFEKYVKGKDNTALNGLKFQCSDLWGKYAYSAIEYIPGSWGEYGAWVGVEGKYVCGMQVSYDIGLDKNDRLGLDGLLFKFCNWYKPIKNEIQDGEYDAVFKGKWGDWQETIKAPSGYQACGFRAKILNDPQDSAGITGVTIIYCSALDWNSKVNNSLGESKYGKPGEDKLCPQGQFIDGVNVKFQSDAGPSVDDQAITGIKFRCSLPSNRSITSEITEEGTNAGVWLEFKSFGAKYLCDAVARIDFTEMGRDTTGVNSLAFKGCDKPDGAFITISTSSLGKWEAFIPSKQGLQILGASGISITNRIYYPNRAYFDSINFIYCLHNNCGTPENPGQASRDSRNTYQTNDIKCAYGHLITSIRVKEEKVVIEGKEVNSISGIEFACSNDPQKSKTLKHEFRSPGTWSAWTDLGDNYICGENQLKDPYDLRDGVSGLYGLMIRKCSNEKKKELTIYEAPRGKFTDFVIPEKGYYACGLWAKTPRETFGIHSLSLNYCEKDNWSQKKYYNEIGFNVQNTIWDYAECPRDYFIVGGSVRYMPPGGDYVGIIAVSITCRNPETMRVTQHTVSDYGAFAQLPWTEDLVDYNYVCGMSAQLEPEEIRKNIHGIKYKLCELK